MPQGYRSMINVSLIKGQTGQFGQINRAIAGAGVQRFSFALAREVAAKCDTVYSVTPRYRDTSRAQPISRPIREESLQESRFGRIAQRNWIVAWRGVPGGRGIELHQGRAGCQNRGIVHRAVKRGVRTPES